MNYKGKYALSKKYKIIFILSAVLLTFVAFLSSLMQNNADFIEKYYSLGYYKFHITVLSKINSFFPFSLAELFIIVGSVALIFFTVRLIISLIKNKNCRALSVTKFVICAFFAFSLLMAMLLIGYLPNYHRYTFSYYSGLTVTETSTENLYELCKSLANDANNYRLAVNQNGEVFDYTKELTTSELFDICTASYQDLLEDYPEYSEIFSVVQNAKAKPVLFSEVMSYMKINGFFFALTGEANVNTHTSDLYIPATTCHELAHIAGFMREDEANFISYLVCRSSQNELLNYSGTMLAFVHSSNALYSSDSEKYWDVISMLSNEVIMDINAHSEYYKAHDTSIGEISTAVNDTYLKANNQDDGVKSYGQMVDLLIADFNLNK